jgi:hypothetical protein
MNASKIATLNHRERAILRAVAAGRCQVTGDACPVLLIDGMGCCDQLAGPRLVGAGLIGSEPGPARITGSGRALLDAA